MEVITVESQAFKEIIKNLEEIKAIHQKNSPIQRKEYLTNHEVSKLLDCSMRSLQNYRDSGELAFYKYGNKLLYKMSDIESFLSKKYQKTF
jgi:hypothetical protein